jgi:pyridoxal biosynthesis lyase PdxS
VSTDELEVKAREYCVPVELVRETAKLQRLPVVWFAAGGIATPADSALVMQLGVDGVFVGSGIFKSSDPPKMARAIVEATRHYDDPQRYLRHTKACRRQCMVLISEPLKLSKNCSSGVFETDEFLEFSSSFSAPIKNTYKVSSFCATPVATKCLNC